MQAVTKIAVLFFLSVGFANGQDEELLGLPVEFDFFGPDFRDEELYKEEDIFKDDTYPESPNTYLEDTIKNLCNQYDLIIDNQRIDCQNIKLAQKALNINVHHLHKRDAGDEAQLEEGSGAGEEVHEPAPEQPTNEVPAEEQIVEEPVEIPKANDTASLAAEGEQELPQEVKEETVAALPTGEELSGSQPDVKEEAVAALPTDEKPSAPQPEEEPNANETVQVEGEQTHKESPAITDTVVEEDHTVPPETEEQAKEAPAVAFAVDAVDVAQPIATGDSEGEQNAEATAQPATEVVKELDATTPGGIKKKGRVLKPIDIGETEETKESETEADKGDTEQLKENQSGIAVFHSDGKGTLEGTDEALNNMKPNEQLKQAPSESQEQTGESTKEIQQGRKDTKVLIILFVAVVVVGGAAFAYNFIKKRKQKKAEATENGGNNTTQRNVQNLTSSAKSDPEHGTELKPLMKTPEHKPVVAEYTDEKENRKTEEVK